MIDFTNYGFTKTEFLYAMILDTHLVSMDISIAEAKLAKVVNPKVIDFKTQKSTSVRIDAVELIDLLNESQETMKTAVDENKDSVDGST